MINSFLEILSPVKELPKMVTKVKSVVTRDLECVLMSSVAYYFSITYSLLLSIPTCKRLSFVRYFSNGTPRQ